MIFIWSCSGIVGRTVFTFTVNRQAFRPDVPVPYVIAVVELQEQRGLRFTTNIVGCAPEAVWIGMPVTVPFERVGKAPRTAPGP